MPLLLTNMLLSQNSQSNCKVVLTNTSSNFSSNNQCFNFNQNYNQAPVLNVNINVHIFRSSRNETDAQLVERVRSLIDESNRVLTDLQANFGDRTPWIKNAKIKMKFLSNLVTQPNDAFGGIWIYPYDGDYSIQIDPPFQNRYGSDVLDIIIMNTGGGSSGLAPLGGGNFSNFIRLSDLNNLVFQSQTPGYDNSYNSGTANLRQLSRVLNHELGHVLNLNHVEFCGNECGNVNINPNSDINPSAECGSRCPNVNTCEGFNPSLSGFLCNDGQRNCLWANSGMMMSQGIWQHSITPCQWSVMFNHIRNNPVNYAKLCFTTAIFTLATSPLNDYRASQSITSTSVIQGNRQVDYWAPTITLNAGFQVAQGTGFVAAPTTFPCCTAGSGGGEPNADNPNNPILDKQNEALTIIPNPFSESINISYEVTENFDNSEMNIIDLSGRVVKNIPIKSQNKGRYQIELKTSDLSNGVYLIRYKSKNQVITKKIVKTSSN
jgi:Secretion system C-terminal sorting domain